MGPMARLMIRGAKREDHVQSFAPLKILVVCQESIPKNLIHILSGLIQRFDVIYAICLRAVSRLNLRVATILFLK
jgi:hypothetical protein